MELIARGLAREVSLGIVVVRADGRREDLGTVSYWHRHWWRRAAYVLTHLGPRPDGKRHGWRGLIRMLFDTTGATVFTHAGKAITTNRVKGAGTEPVNFGWGTGAGTAAAADTTLFAEKAVDLVATTGTRTAGTSTQQTTTQTNDTYQVVATRTATGAGTVTNAGLFDDVNLGSGNLYMKGDFTGIGLASGDSIQGTCKVSYA